MVRIAAVTALVGAFISSAAIAEESSSPLSAAKCTQGMLKGNWFIGFQLAENIACTLDATSAKKFEGACSFGEVTDVAPAVATLGVNEACGVNGQIKSDGNFKLIVSGRISADGNVIFGALLKESGQFFLFNGIKGPIVE